jgi:hypothetical protein
MKYWLHQLKNGQMNLQNEHAGDPLLLTPLTRKYLPCLQVGCFLQAFDREGTWASAFDDSHSHAVVASTCESTPSLGSLPAF